MTAGLKVGELARRTGLTVRTLHHYDEIGLLRPSQHMVSGHRLYTAADVARLQRVLSLRQLGFGLEEVRQCLDQPSGNQKMLQIAWSAVPIIPPVAFAIPLAHSRILP